MQLAADMATSNAMATSAAATPTAAAQQTADAQEAANIAMLQRDAEIRLEQEQRREETWLRFQPILYGLLALVLAAVALALAFFLALVVERVIQFVVRPLVEALFKAAGWDVEKVSLVLPYVAAVLGAAVAWGFGLDLFADLAAAVGLTPAVWFTKGLTALVVAGGSNLLHDLWPQEMAMFEVEPRDGELEAQVFVERPTA